MQTTIKQAVEYICKKAAFKYAPKVWLNVPFTSTYEIDENGYQIVEVAVGNIIRKVIWDPKSPSPRTVSTCTLVSDGFGNFIATAHGAYQHKPPEESEDDSEKTPGEILIDILDDLLDDDDPEESGSK